MSAPVSNVFSGNTVALVKAGMTRLNGYFLDNTENSATTFFQFFDAPGISSVTLGSSAPTMSIAIPSGQAANLSFEDPVQFVTGLCVAQTTTRSGNTAPSSNCSYNFAIS